MTKSWEGDSCEQVQSYYTLYPVAVAAALWCRVPPSEINEHLKIAVEVNRGVYKHPYIPCLEPRCRAIHEAIDKGALLVSRENGKAFDGTSEHVAHERRHVNRQHLKSWITREFPSDKPQFLFDEVERQTHTAISADAYRVLQADRDALKARIEKAEDWARRMKDEKMGLLAELESLRATAEKMNTPSRRAETTYLNIIGALVTLMLATTPAGKAHSIFQTQASVITALLAHFEGKPGISARTLEEKFAAAIRTLNAT